MNDRNALLSRLKIERDGPGGGRRLSVAWLLPAFILGAGALLAGRCVFVGGGNTGPASETTQRPPGTELPATSTGAPTPPDKIGPAPPIATVNDTRVLNASGYITARRMATVSAEITGRITEVLVEEGMTVEKDQIVARLDDALAQVDLHRAKARIGAAQATIQGLKVDLAEAKRVLRRTTELAARQNISEAALTKAKAGVEGLKAQLAGATAQLKISHIEVSRQTELVDDHLVRAPFAGVVIDKSAQAGEIVSPISAGGGFTRTGICTLVDMNSLEIEVDVNEAFIGRVFAGQAVEATLDAYPDQPFGASVIAIVPTANRQRATVKVRIGIDRLNRRILPDMGVKVAFLKRVAFLKEQNP